MKIKTVVLTLGEILEETGQPGIQGISNCMDDFCFREHADNQSNELEIERVFIDDSGHALIICQRLNMFYVLSGKSRIMSVPQSGNSVGIVSLEPGQLARAGDNDLHLI